MFKKSSKFADSESLLPFTLFLLFSFAFSRPLITILLYDNAQYLCVYIYIYTFHGPTKEIIH